MVDKTYKHNDKDEKRLNEFKDNFKKYKPNENQRDITYADILDITYKYYLDDNDKPKDGFFDDRLFDGDFSPLQAKQFFERYDLLEYYPKDNSKGFHACLFQDRESKEHILAIRGSFDSTDYTTDFVNLFTDSTNP